VRGGRNQRVPPASRLELSSDTYFSSVIKPIGWQRRESRKGGGGRETNRHGRSPTPRGGRNSRHWASAGQVTRALNVKRKFGFQKKKEPRRKRRVTEEGRGLTFSQKRAPIGEKGAKPRNETTRAKTHTLEILPTWQRNKNPRWQKEWRGKREAKRGAITSSPAHR